jgi:hypothetical protein
MGHSLATTGAPGGFSFTATSPLVKSDRGPAQITIAADAGAWSDAQREHARRVLDAVAPTDSSLLLQFSAASDIAAVFVALAPGVAVTLLSDALVEAVKHLVRIRSPSMTRIEVHRVQGDEETTAIVTTSDPKVVAEAIRRLPVHQDKKIITFDDDWNWPDRPPS